MRKNIIKKRELPIRQIKELLAQVKQLLPQWLNSPSSFLIFILNFFNNLTIVFCYLILIGQTTRILMSEQKYVNVKALMIKWLIFVFFQLVFSHVSKENIEGSFIKSFFLVVVLLIIFPSQVSKSIFRKYFEGQQNLIESSPMTDSSIANNNSLLEKLIVVILVYWIKIIKHILTFINPSLRKPVNEEINEINTVLNEEKYFWKIYTPEANKKNQKTEPKQLFKQFENEVYSNSKAPEFSVTMVAPPPQLPQETGMNFQETIEKQLKKGLVEVMDMEKNLNNATTINNVKGIDLINTKFSGNKNSSAHQTPTSSQLQLQTPPNPSRSLSSTSRQKKYKKYSVSQYLPLFSTTNRSSVYPNLPNKRCTYYREIQISYDVNSAVMTVTSLEDMKVSYHSLEEIALLEDLMVQFQFEENQQMIVKFKNRTEFQEFISSIDMYQSGLNNN